MPKGFKMEEQDSTVILRFGMRIKKRSHVSSSRDKVIDYSSKIVKRERWHPALEENKF